MPGTYAHYAFGKKVLQNTNEEIKKIILENKKLFYIGLHGPDILFYYKPLKSKNIIKKIGSDMHEEKANIFFEKARKIILQSKNKEDSLAYIFGFICHFILDSECHPYINKVSEEFHISHTEIESEFDKLLLNIENKNPFKVNLTEHISTDSKSISIVYPFFNLDEKHIYDSLKSMKFYNSIFNTNNKAMRFIIFSSLKIANLYETTQGMFFKIDNNPKCKDICLNLEDLYNKSIPKASYQLSDFYDSFKNNKPLSERFNRNFE